MNDSETNVTGFLPPFKIFLCSLDSDTSDDVTMILSNVSESKEHRNILKWRQKTCHFGFLIIHFNSKSRYLQNLTFFLFWPYLGQFLVKFNYLRHFLVFWIFLNLSQTFEYHFLLDLLF